MRWNCSKRNCVVLVYWLIFCQTYFLCACKTKIVKRQATADDVHFWRVPLNIFNITSCSAVAWFGISVSLSLLFDYIFLYIYITLILWSGCVPFIQLIFIHIQIILPFFFSVLWEATLYNNREICVLCSFIHIEP